MPQADFGTGGASSPLVNNANPIPGRREKSAAISFGSAAARKVAQASLSAASPPVGVVTQAPAWLRKRGEKRERSWQAP